MHKTNNSYPIHQSPFYKLKTKKKLARLLRITQKQLLSLTDDSKYHTFLNKKNREIQEPIGIRKIVHRRFKELFGKIECPKYLFSGVKGKSAIANAEYHKMNTYAMTADIKSFYRYSNIEYVFRFFYYTMEMEPDVARILSNILCYKTFIPTGSPSSQLLAYWTYSVLFNRINNFSNKKNISFSLYVDDMTFSSESKIPKKFDLQINILLKKVHLKIQSKKTKYYFSTNDKFITGCIVSHKNELKVLNKHKKKIIHLLNKYNTTNSNLDKYKIKNSLIGTITHVQQIEKNIFETTRKQIANN